MEEGHSIGTSCSDAKGCKEKGGCGEKKGQIMAKDCGPCGQKKGAKPSFEEQDRKIKDQLSSIKNKLIIMSGKGGVGKSSITASLARAFSKAGFNTGVLDVDLHGPSMATMMGITALLDVDDDKTVLPITVNDHLKVVSMQSLMAKKDQAIIWRGPAKTGVIRQFISDVKWQNLDFLLIDAPPGTGDEPLSVAQNIPDARAIIVTTSQDVALADVRKSIHFCRTVHMNILGLVENMGPFPCPCCDKTIELFKKGGGKRTAEEANIPFLGTLPFDPKVVSACDQGVMGKKPEISATFEDALEAVVKKIVSRL